MPKTKVQDTVITIWDKIGYAFGDMGFQLTFCLVGPFLMLFYTDIVGLPLGQVTAMILITRIWGAFSDPIAGSLIDRGKPRKQGRFRHWILLFAGPLAVSVVLLFINPKVGPTGALIWAYAANFAYGAFFSGANIPYGSLASVISPLESDRSALSTFRTMGQGIGAAMVTVIMPLVIYSTNTAGAQSLDAGRLQLSVIVLAVITGGVVAAASLMTKERVAAPENVAPPNAAKTMLFLLRNRPFLVLCLASMLHVGVMVYTQTVNTYLFKDYFHQASLYSMFNLLFNAPVAAGMFVVAPLVRRFGKKETCAAGLVLTAAAYFVAYILQLTNPWAYLAFCFLNGLGLVCFTCQVWALVTDVIDYQSLLSGQRDEGTAFGCYFFSRKIGQTVATSGGALVLKTLGYIEASGGVAAVQPAHVAAGMYRAATLIPGVAMLIMFLLMAFAYPLNRAKLREVHEEMRARQSQEIVLN